MLQSHAPAAPGTDELLMHVCLPLYMCSAFPGVEVQLSGCLGQLEGTDKRKRDSVLSSQSVFTVTDASGFAMFRSVPICKAPKPGKGRMSALTGGQTVSQCTLDVRDPANFTFTQYVSARF